MYENKTSTGRVLVAHELKTSAGRVHHFIRVLESMVENINETRRTAFNFA